MARQVLPFVGAVVGSFFGSPQLGWAIGSIIGNAVDPQVIQGPRIGEIAQQTAQEGGPRPFVIGTSPPISGNIIASGAPRIVKKTSGGKGGPKVKTESVFRTYAIGVCEGETELLRAWRNNTLVYDVTQTPLVTNEDNTKFLQNARWFSGSFEQNPSPDLEALFGVGTTPAHRGTAYLVMADEDLTDLRGAIPQWTFRVQRCATDTELLLTANTGELIEHVSPATSVITVYENHTTPPASGISGLQAKFPVASFRNVNHGGSLNQVNWIDVYDSSDPDRFIFPGAFTFEGWFFRVNDSGQDPLTLLVPNMIGPSDGWYFLGVRSSGVGGQLQFDVGGGGDGGQFAGAVVGTSVWNHVAVTRDEDGVIRGFVDGVKSATEYSYVGPVGARGVDDITHVGVLRGFAVASGDFDGYFDQIRMAHACVYTDDFTPPAAPFTLASFSGACTQLLSETITQICERAGLPSSLIDVSLIEGELFGILITNSYPAAESLRALGQVFFFDFSNYDGKIHFIPRGANSVATITESDMLDDDEEIEDEKRGDALSIPRVLHVNYYDIAGGLSSNKQTSERAGDRRALGEQSLQSAVVMDANQAARVAVINHKVMAERQGAELKFRLPDNWLKLVPSDPVIVQWQGHSVRAMLEHISTQDGFQEYSAVRDRQSGYVSEVEGIPPPPQTAPPSTVVGDTLIEPMDIHILQDADDNVGLSYYVAVSGLLPAWTGALIELSMDGGINYIDSASTDVSAVMGEVLVALPDHPQAYPDTTNTFLVTIQTPFAELLSTDIDGLLNRENLALVGDEIIQFMTADEISEGVWELSYLLRGRKGTSTTSHAVGQRFVLLDRSSIAMIPAGLLDIGRTLTFRATSFGNVADSSSVTVDMTYTGRSQIEREVSHLTARREGSDAVVDWIGIGRLGGGAAAAHGSRFTGYRVTFDDGSSAGTIVVDTTAQTLTQDVTGLASPITITVQQVNALTGAGPSTEVLLI